MITVRALDAGDKGYALYTWREGHKKSPSVSRLPWAYYKDVFGYAFEKLLDDPTSRVLGAYTAENELVGWLVMTPGKRVHALHWVHVKYELADQPMRRRGVMTALLEAAELGKNFVYTLRARRDRAPLPDGSTSKSLDETLVAALRARGVAATYIPLKEFLR